MLLLLSVVLLGSCADWQVKPSGEQPTSSQEQPTPQGSVTIGGEGGKQVK